MVYRFFDKLLDRLAVKAADGGLDLLKQWICTSDEIDDSHLIEFISGELEAAGLDKERARKSAPAILSALRVQRSSVSKIFEGSR